MLAPAAGRQGQRLLLTLPARPPGARRHWETSTEGPVAGKGRLPAAPPRGSLRTRTVRPNATEATRFPAPERCDPRLLDGPCATEAQRARRAALRARA